MCIRDSSDTSPTGTHVTTFTELGVDQDMVDVLAAQGIVAVSYTHLDVYKRQTFSCITDSARATI